jgi:Amt family ammonium transporter
MILNRCGINLIIVHEEFDTDIFLNALAVDLASAYSIVHAPYLFAERVNPTPPEGEGAAIRQLIEDFLWPMAQKTIEHNLMNRVRRNPQSLVVPYRILISPLVDNDHSLGFAAVLRTHDQEPFSPADLAKLKTALGELNECLAARVDTTTGLLLRPAFEEEVLQRKRAMDSACVVYANLDRVHVVNEVAGFAAGDQAIRDVARFWQAQLKPTGSIATHLSGDRFAAVLFNHTLNQARYWADKTREGIEHLHDRKVTASLGVAALSDVEEFQHALAAAETACRVAKERGRNRVELYVTGDHTVIRRHEQVHESRVVLDALDNDRFTLYAQPIVKLDESSHPRHYEILLRVQRPDGDVTSIGGFLDAAERYQLLERLDSWVLAHVLTILAPSAQKLRAVGTSFAVNITGQSLSQPAFADFVRTKIKLHDIPAGLLDFELTETAAVRNLNATRRFISRMAEIGAHVALDDFGTGLSSLMHLKDLDVHRIKIDGKFVRDVLSNARSRALIRALVQIADEIGLETVAEFVETEAVASSVRELGVQSAQGYFYGRPRPLTEVLHELAAIHQEEPSELPVYGAVGLR